MYGETDWNLILAAKACVIVWGLWVVLMVINLIANIGNPIKFKHAMEHEGGNWLIIVFVFGLVAILVL